MVLEGRMPVCLGKVTRVAGLGEQAEIGQFKRLNHVCPFREPAGVVRPFVRTMRPRGEKQNGLDAQT